MLDVAGAQGTAMQLVDDPIEIRREIANPSRIALPAAVKFAALGLAAYALALIATFPARTALDWAGQGAAATLASGTVWNGRTEIGRGIAASWRAAPFRSLGVLAIAADLRIDGPATALTGRTRWRPGMLALDGVSGRAGWPLVAALAPKFPLSCELSIGVDLPSVLFAGPKSGADGRLTSGMGTCRGSTGATSSLPALVAVATRDDAGSRATLNALTGSAAPLAEASLTRDGTVRAALLPAGSALLPPGAFAGGMTLETKL